MTETRFEKNFLAVRRMAAVHAAKLIQLSRLPADHHDDVVQVLLLGMWRKAESYDAQRASWSTFAERVISNQTRSLSRRLHAARRGHGREEPLALSARTRCARDVDIELRMDVKRVLDGVSRFDRAVAFALAEYSVSETARRLGVSRSTLYQSVNRLRDRFSRAGFDPRRRIAQHKPAIAPVR